MRALIADELRETRDAFQDPRRTLIAAGQANGDEDEELPGSATWLTMTVGRALARSHEDRPPKVSASDRTRHVSLFRATRRRCCISSAPMGSVPPCRCSNCRLRKTLLQAHPCAAFAPCPITKTLSPRRPNAGGGRWFPVARDERRPGQTHPHQRPARGLGQCLLRHKPHAGDSLLQVLLTDGAREVLLASSGARAIRFDENDVRHTGLAAGAVRGMRLLDGKERVIGAALLRNGLYVWSITGDGLAQCALADEFPSQGRGGQGVRLTRLPQGSRGLVAAMAGRQQDNLLVLTNRNKARYMRLGLAPRLRRGQAGSDYILTCANASEWSPSSPISESSCLPGQLLKRPVHKGRLRFPVERRHVGAQPVAVHLKLTVQVAQQQGSQPVPSIKTWRVQIGRDQMGIIQTLRQDWHAPAVHGLHHRHAEKVCHAALTT